MNEKELKVLEIIKQKFKYDYYKIIDINGKVRHYIKFLPEFLEEDEYKIFKEVFKNNKNG